MTTTMTAPERAIDALSEDAYETAHLLAKKLDAMAVNAGEDAEEIRQLRGLVTVLIVCLERL